MRHDNGSRRPRFDPQPKEVLPFLGAAFYAALVVGVGVLIRYGGGFDEYGIGIIAFVTAFLMALFWACILAPVFYLAHLVLNNALYLSLHLVVGVAIGANRAARNPFALEWHHFIVNHDALVVICASLAAWLYVTTRVPARRPKLLRSPDAPDVSLAFLTLGAIVLAPVVAFAPVPVDKSCHNVFRGGRTSAKPALMFTIRVDELERSGLVRLYERFQEDYALSIRGDTRNPKTVGRLLCNDDLIFQIGGVRQSDDEHFVSIFTHMSATNWEPIAHGLVCRIEKGWGDSLTFQGGRGLPIERPEIVAMPCPAD